MLWQPEFALGEETIDAQHKQLFNLLDKLYAAISSGERKEFLQMTFLFLADYAREHFAYEEELMKKFNYPDIETHITEHQRFRDDLKFFQEDFISSGDTSGPLINLIGQISEWLVYHILNVDQQMGAYLHSISSPEKAP